MKKGSKKESRKSFVNRILRLFGPPSEIANDVGQLGTLDGVYTGSSERIYRLIRIAYWRGVRRGLGLAWESKQSISLRQGD